ncbi:MAG: endonuclease V, partial [Syntrophorhabdaceae bacterium]|nr:endonuclease V [Syntrophorhabdaceae bacterium]
IQKRLKRRLNIVPLAFKPSLVCGLDAAFSGSYVYGCASLFTFPEMEHIEDSLSEMEVRFPYVPTFLSFREGEALIEAIEGLRETPDILLFDGHGIAHPRSLGIASHIGVLLDTPSIGCAKERLIGVYEEPPIPKGSFSYLYHRKTVVGAVLRTVKGVKPLFISPGHLIDIDSAIEIVMGTIKGFRIPEPIRRAHTMARLYAKGNRV